MTGETKIIYVGDAGSMATLATTLAVQDPRTEAIILTGDDEATVRHLSNATRDLQMVIVALGSIDFDGGARLGRGTMGLGGGLSLVLRASEISIPAISLGSITTADEPFQSYPDRRFAHAAQYRINNLNLVAQYREAAKWNSGAKHAAHGGRENRHAERQRNAAAYKPQ